MAESSYSHRVTKNTLFLYFRHGIIMLVSLYTSRIILETLGVDDFGIYNVVGGIVALFSVVNSTISGVTVRFLSAEIGKGNKAGIGCVFSTSMVLQISFCLIVLLLGETIGYWFLNVKINIPIERIEAANFVYQFSLFSACASIILIPFYASVIAHERMKFFAYMSIVDASLKLAIVFLLQFFEFDKLKLFAILIFIIGIFILIIYNVYCHRNFTDMRFKWIKKKDAFKPFLVFSGWSFLDGLAFLVATQGINILLNLFHGVVVNATMAIASKVNNAVFSFAWNFLTASTPVLTKIYAAGEKEIFNRILARTEKISFLLCFVLAFPLILNIDFVLQLWLTVLPPGVALFCKWILIIFMIVSLISPIGIGLGAIGKIKWVSIVNSIIVTSILVFSYVFLYFGFQPIVVLYVTTILRIIQLGNNLYFLRKLSGISLMWFFNRVFLRIFIVALFSVILPIIVSIYTFGWTRFLMTGMAFLAIFFPTVWLIGLEASERKSIAETIKQKLSRALG